MPPSDTSIESPYEIEPDWDRRPTLTYWVRGMLILIAGGLISVFAVAMWLNPYEPDGTPKRMATHHQMGLPPCSFLIMTGKPCPSCGMTTSFSLLAHGDILHSMQANWVGTFLAIVGMVLIPWQVISAVRGRWAWGVVEIERKLIMLTTLFVILTLIRWGFVLGWQRPI